MELRCMLRCGGHNNLGLGHNNVLGALDLVPSAPPGAASWLVLECAPRGDLLNAVERLASSGRTLSEPAARALFHQLVTGVAHCHAAGVSRGDLSSTIQGIQAKAPQALAMCIRLEPPTHVNGGLAPRGSSGNGLKPEPLLLDDRRFDLKIADFGLACAATEPPGARPSTWPRS